MLSIESFRGIAFAAAYSIIALSAVPAAAQIELGINSGAVNNTVCLAGTALTTFEDNDSCDGARTDPTRLTLIGTGGFTNFDLTTGSVDFTDNTVQFNSATVAFGGGTAAFNNAVSFTGPSVTFTTATTFNNSITTNGISNTGTISSGSLSSNSIFANTSSVTNSGVANLVVATTLTLGSGVTVDMGGNVIGGVAAGVADTDAVNVAQLNAATAGVTADVTALENLTGTHTTQITNLQSTTATHTTQITNLQTGLAQTNEGLAAEAAARISANNALDSRVDSLEAITANLDERFGDVEDRSDAGTAAAVALSGAMFLPGKTFNLTGNVGAYRGAVAGALQVGALVSDMVAVNAGIAHGFNKGGKTALRAGFTLGW